VNDQVDIINISWTYPCPTTNIPNVLQAAIENARDNSILVFCSTIHSRNSNIGIYPANFPSCVEVAAATMRGRRADDSPSKIDILIPGEDMPVEGPGYFSSPTSSIAGRSPSAATALASAIASILLVCALVFVGDEAGSSSLESHTLDRDGEIFKKLKKAIGNKEEILNVFEMLRKQRNDASMSADHDCVDPNILFGKAFNFVDDEPEPTNAFKSLFGKFR